VSKDEKKLRDTLKTNCQSMISLYIQFEPTQVIQSSIFLIAFLSKYFTSLFNKASKLLISKSGSKAQQQQQIYSHLACQLDNYSLLQMKYLAYNLLSFVNDLLVSEELIIKLAALYEEKQSKEYAQLFQDLLEKILLLILKLTQIFSTFEAQIAQMSKATMTPDKLLIVEDFKRFHRTILNKSYDLMEKTLALLDSEQFINVIKRLIKHDSIQIRRRSLALLNNKLRKYEPSEQEVTLLISMIDDLLNSMQLSKMGQSLTVKNGLDTSTDTNVTLMETDIDITTIHSETNSLEIEINNQTILFSIKLLCKRIGEQNPLAFVRVIKYLSENLIDKSLYIVSGSNNSVKLHNVNLLSSVLLCIGEVCLKLKSSALTYLNQIMLFTLEIVDEIRAKLGDSQQSDDIINDFTQQKENSSESKTSFTATFKSFELLTISCVTCLLKVVQNLANFLSPFLPRLFYVSSALSYLSVKNDNFLRVSAASLSNSPQIDFKLSQLRSTLATLIPLRLLAPILSEQSTSVCSTIEPTTTKKVVFKMKIKHVEYYMQISRLAIQNASQEDLLANIRILRSMFMNLFEMRAFYVKTTKRVSN
jgi:hypothetical protein